MDVRFVQYYQYVRLRCVGNLLYQVEEEACIMIAFQGHTKG